MSTDRQDDIVLSRVKFRGSNGIVFTIAKNLPKGTAKTVRLVAFTPEPRIIGLEMAPGAEQPVAVGGASKTATHYIPPSELHTSIRNLESGSGSGLRPESYPMESENLLKERR